MKKHFMGMVMGVMLLFSLPLMAQTGKEWDDVRPACSLHQRTSVS